MHDVISCPKCRHEFDLNKAVKNQLSSEVNIKYKEHYKERDADIARQEAQNSQTAETNNQKAIELANREEDLNAKYRNKEQEANELDKRIEKRALDMMNAKRLEIANEEKEKAEAIYTPELTKASNTEIENIKLRQKVTEFEQSHKNINQRNEQKLNEALADKEKEYSQQREFDKIHSDKILAQASENFSKGLVQTNQGSSQAQGSVGETSVKNHLES